MKRFLQNTHLVSTALLLYWLVLFLLTHLPIRGPGGIAQNDKFLHFGAYAGLSLLMATLAARGEALRWGSALMVLLLAGGYGVADELLQGLVPSRHPDFFDWLADLAGIVAGLCVYVLVQQLVLATRMNTKERRAGRGE